MKRPQGILFDLGNTLLHEEAFDIEAGTQRVLSFATNPKQVSAHQVCELVAELESDLRERREASWIEISPFTVHRLIYEPHGIGFNRPFREVEREFFSAAMRFRPTEGVQEFLELVRRAGLPLGVVSNSAFSSQTLAWQIAQFGLGSFFTFVMSSGDYVVRKPHPGIFLAAARKLGVDPPELWFVGDSPVYDVAGAANAGIVSVLYRTQGAHPPSPAPDLQVASWQELGEVFAAA